MNKTRTKPMINSGLTTTGHKLIRDLAIVVAVSLGTVSSHAQGDPADNKVQVEITTTTQTEESTDWGYDRNAGRSRIGMSGQKLPGKTKLLKSTTEIRQTIDLEHTPSSVQCESDIDLEYYQKDTATEVRTLFTSANCADFDATYQLRIMYFDASGEMQRIVADEEWPAGKTERHRKLFPLEPNSTLHRVSSRILSCTCAESQ